MKFDPKKLNALAVCLHGRQIGVINRLAGERHIFAFEQDYIADPQRPTLSLSFKSSTGGLVTADRRTPVLYPAYDFVATLPYLHGDTLALTFGGGRSLAGITTDQMRHFADAARIPASGRLRWRRQSVPSERGKHSNRPTCSPKTCVHPSRNKFLLSLLRQSDGQRWHQESLHSLRECSGFVVSSRAK